MNIPFFYMYAKQLQQSSAKSDMSDLIADKKVTGKTCLIWFIAMIMFVAGGRVCWDSKEKIDEKLKTTAVNLAESKKMNTQRDVLTALSLLGLVGATACGLKNIDNALAYSFQEPSKLTKEHTR